MTTSDDIGVEGGESSGKVVSLGTAPVADAPAPADDNVLTIGPWGKINEVAAKARLAAQAARDAVAKKDATPRTPADKRYEEDVAEIKRVMNSFKRSGDERKMSRAMVLEATLKCLELVHKSRPEPEEGAKPDDEEPAPKEVVLGLIEGLADTMFNVMGVSGRARHKMIHEVMQILSRNAGIYMTGDD